MPLDFVSGGQFKINLKEIMKGSSLKNQKDLLNFWAERTPRLALLLITLDLLNKPGQKNILEPGCISTDLQKGGIFLHNQTCTSSEMEICGGKSPRPLWARQGHKGFLRSSGSSSCLSPGFDVLQIPRGSKLTTPKARLVQVSLAALQPNHT
jgi:hypothetical protein